ncbi:hypothetical protein MMC20_003350 [Loxospora ochrophaea]|nr:hypothetical protein [Loxospora ochrophaea]
MLRLNGQIGAHWKKKRAAYFIAKCNFDECSLKFEATLKASPTGEAFSYPYAVNIDANSQEEREMLVLPAESPLNQFQNDTLARTRNEYASVHTPTAYISTGPNTPFAAHKEDFNLLSINYLWLGVPCLGGNEALDEVYYTNAFYGAPTYKSYRPLIDTGIS